MSSVIRYSRGPDVTRQSELYLRDILKAIRRIHNYTEDLDRNEFDEDSKTLDATLRNVEIIGEAAASLPESLRENHPDVPWREDKDFRNVVAHQFWEVDTDLVWDVIQNKLGPLREQVADVLGE